MKSTGKVKISGRYYDDGSVLWLSTSGAQIGFQVAGASRFALMLAGDRAAVAEDLAHLRARYQIEVDGKTWGDFLMEGKARVHALPVTDGRTHEVRLIKLSEAPHSSLGVSAIATDGAMTPLPEKALKIEFIGDSITCGYGVEGTLDMTFSTATENALMAFAARAAQTLDADYCLTAFSGFGIVSGYTGDGAINARCLVPKYYESVSMCDEALPDGRRLMDIPWDFHRFVPDYIVINLGTNDMSYCGADEEKRGRYRELYGDFLRTVRRRNPGARILCLLGVMGEALCPYMESAVADYRAKTGDGNVRVLCVREQDPALGYGTSYHPSKATHARLAAEVAACLREWMSET